MVLERRDPLIISRPYYLKSFDCGYCRCRKPHNAESLHNRYPSAAKIQERSTHATIGCSVEQMTCKDYDEFMNMGFRRLGTFLYKGDMLRGCCRMCTIRTQLQQMKVTKEHRQVVNRFKKAILDTGAEPSGSLKKIADTLRPNAPFELSSLIHAEKESSRFHTRFEPAEYSEEKYALYRKYQVVVHNDRPEDITPRLFVRFLCNLPFLGHEKNGTEAEWQALNSWVETWENEETDVTKGDGDDGRHQTDGKDNGPANEKRARRVARVGPTHELYYLDGKLIAISVLDFLPSGVSSVYLIWDPDFAHLSLGTLLGIREVQMCYELNLGYYYLGYYIEDCDKMRYKKKFGGEVLDVCTEVFVPLEKIRPMMRNDDFWTLSHSGNEKDDDDEREHELTLAGNPGQRQARIVNVAHKVYGNEETYEVANSALGVLDSLFGYSSSELPAVLPGAMPLYQLASWVKTNAADSDFRTVVFSTRTGRLHQSTIGELGSRERGHVIDFLRLFGLERTQSSIIVV